MPDTEVDASRSLRVATWLWLVVCASASVVGMTAVYLDPSIVRIDDFTRLYNRVGFEDELMVTALLTCPLILALAAATIITIRRRDDRAALLLALGLTSLYYFSSGAARGIEQEWVRNGTASTAIVLIVIFLAVFPSGSFRPRWAMIAPLLAVLVAVAEPGMAADSRDLLSPTAIEHVSFVAWGGWTAMFVIIASAQVVRYRRFSTPSQRDQSRWVLLGMAFFVAPPVFLLVLTAAGQSSPGAVGGLVLIAVIGSLLLPVTVLIAAFRHHLYDIDALISRTVTYTIVAIVVAAVYAVPVVTLPWLLGGSSDLVVAGSTLLAAAVFNPARRRIQRSVDRRFHRARYDAEQEVVTMAGRLAGEIDLTSVNNELTDVVERTLAPASTSVWLREES